MITIYITIIKMKKARAGSIFKDYRNTNEFLDKNTIIYGHNMKDGSMFADLRKYLDKDFFGGSSNVFL